MWIVAIIGAGILTATIQLLFQGFDTGYEHIMETYLLHQFAVSHGIIAVGGFIINVLQADRTAERLGWPGGPFQIKYGFAQVGLGVMGVMSIWFRGNFWVGTLVTLYIYGLSGLWTHTMELRRKQREGGSTDWIELGNIVLDVIYHIVLTWMSLQIPGVWSLQ